MAMAAGLGGGGGGGGGGLGFAGVVRLAVSGLSSGEGGLGDEDAGAPDSSQPAWLLR